MTIAKISNIDLKLLQVFMTVTRCGGFSLAQTELNVSQATISTHIKTLETRLGLTLCQRGRGGFALTEDGQRVHDATNGLFNHLEDFRSVVLRDEKLVGDLQIGVIDNTITNPEFQLSDAIKKFGQLDHNVDITIHVASPNKLEQMLLMGEIHIALGFFPRRLSQLDYEYAFTTRMELFCGNSHPLFNIPEQHLNIIDIEHAEHARRGYVSVDQSPKYQRNFIYSARADNVEGLAQLTLSGHYLAFLPCHYAEQWVHKNKMRSLLPAHFSFESEYEIIRRSGAARTPSETKFFELLKSIMTEI